MLLEQAWNYINDAKYNKAAKICENFLENEHVKLQTEAHKLAALAYFKLKEFSKSTYHYSRITQKSEESEDWFSLAIAAGLSADYKLSDEAFEKAIQYYNDAHSNASISIPNMRLFYLQNLIKSKQTEKAIHQANELKNIYIEQEITDKAYLFMDGVPEFKEALTSMIEALKMKPDSNIKQWLSDLEEAIDEEGKKTIKNQIKNL